MQQNGREAVEIGVGAPFEGEIYGNTAVIYPERSRIPVCGKCGKKPRFYLKEAIVKPHESRVGKFEEPGYALWWDCLKCGKNGPVPAHSHSHHCSLQLG
jgi:hypothetical protein